MSSRFVISCSSRLGRRADVLEHDPRTLGVERLAVEHVGDRRGDGGDRALQLVRGGRQQRAPHVLGPLVQLGLAELLLPAARPAPPARPRRRTCGRPGSRRPSAAGGRRRRPASRPAPGRPAAGTRSPTTRPDRPRRGPTPGRTRAVRRRGRAPGVRPSARSDTSTWLRSNSSRTSASRSSAAVARSCATPTSHEINSDIAMNARNATTYSVRSRSNVPYGGRNPTLYSADPTIAATMPGTTPPSHDATTTGTRNANAVEGVRRAAPGRAPSRRRSRGGRAWRRGRRRRAATRACGRPARASTRPRSDPRSQR